ncbi:MAG: TonB family protein [Vibrionaceae bacterium]
MSCAPRLSSWFGGSIALHVLLLAAFGLKMPNTPLAPPAAPSTRLSLGMAAALAGASAQSATAVTAQTQPMAAETEQKTEPQKKVEPKPTPVPESKPVSQNVANVKTLTAQKPKPAPAKSTPTPPKPVKQTAKTARKTEVINHAPPPKVVHTPTPPPQVAQRASQAGNMGRQGSQQNANQQQETGQAAQHGGQALSDQFDLQIRQHLLANQKTPKVLGRNSRGTVEVEFVIDRQGKLVRQNIGKPSRIREFDRAARALVASAAPYPKAPPQLTWQERRYRIAIHYQSQ